MGDFQRRLQFLYRRFIQDEATEGEVRELWDMMGRPDAQDAVKEAVFAVYNDAVPEEIHKKDWDGAVERMVAQPKEISGRFSRMGWWAAASIALLVGAAGYLYFTAPYKIPETTYSTPVPPDKQDIAPPASSRATITLADGKKIFLDSTNSGMLARQSNVNLKKTGEGEIVYDKGGASPNGEMIYNTLANPKGSRVIGMTLSDGSRLWLNAGSSVTFPIAFNGGERKILMTGEAYFEIAHNPSKKFIVTANGLTTEVLGTHFNVNAYGDGDRVKVTLLEGSVKVIASDGRSSMIKPGEQAAETVDGILKMGRPVNVEEVIAWKNEMFSFNETDIKDIMKEVSRWYDVDIAYSGEFEGLAFGGTISRQKNVSELLKRLEATKALKFSLNGRRIIVTQIK